MELRREIAENKEYVQQLHNELEKMDRQRKRERSEILESCVKHVTAMLTERKAS